MGLWENWGKPQGKTDKSGMMTGKQARQYVKETKHCKHGGCNETPGGHSFRFPKAQEYCTDHAREMQTTRNKNAAAEKAAADKRQAARDATKRKAAEKARQAREAKRKR